TLDRKGIENGADREGSYRFLTTGAPESFREIGRRFLQLPIGDVEHVDVAALERPAAAPARPAAAGRTSSARSISSPTSSNSPTARSSTRRVAPSFSAPPRSRTACRRGCGARGRAG